MIETVTAIGTGITGVEVVVEIGTEVAELILSEADGRPIFTGWSV